LNLTIRQSSAYLSRRPLPGDVAVFEGRSRTPVDSTVDVNNATYTNSTRDALL